MAININDIEKAVGPHNVIDSGEVDIVKLVAEEVNCTEALLTSAFHR